MADALQSTWLLALVRAIHFASCLLAFGVVAFDRWIAAPTLEGCQPPVAVTWVRSASWLVWLSMLIALVSGTLWLALIAISMTGLPPNEALRGEVLKVVVSDTHFGHLWGLRAVLWIGAILAICLRIDRRIRTVMTWFALALSGLFAVTLAGAGHGLDGRNSWWHLAADAIHILIGGIWPTGLIPFAMLFLKLRRDNDGQRWTRIGNLTRRFSAASLLGVSMLLATGLVNSFYMLNSVSDLTETDYGKLLLAKMIAFLAMVALGALNLSRWKPRLSAGYDDRTPAAAARLQINVAVEAGLSLAVLIFVGFLGILMPPMSELHHHH